MSPSSISISKLRADVDGRVIAPEDAEYDQARALFYGGMDRHPAAIVRVKDDMDVVRVVALARESGLELAVRSGGHSIPGHSVSEGGIVIDLADMRALEIDVEARTAWAQTGLTALGFTTAAAEHGLGVGFGDTGSVGIGGITLGGGVGYLVRKYGLTIDDLLAADIVTADGEIRHVDAEHEPDLFWAIRGGGGTSASRRGSGSACTRSTPWSAACCSCPPTSTRSPASWPRPRPRPRSSRRSRT